MRTPDPAAAISCENRMNFVDIILEMVAGPGRMMEMEESNKSRTKVLITGFLKEKLPNDLRMRVGEWISRLGDNGEGMDALQEVFDELNERYPRPDVRTARQWREFCRKVGLSDRGAARALFYKRVFRVAAVLLPVVIAGTGLLLYNSPKVPAGQPEAVYTSIEASGGTRRVVELPCSTEVILNSGAAIQYDEAGYMTERNVRLGGEAYFSVAKSEGKVFKVEAGEVTITVLGTEFNVKVADRRTEVSLFKGSVSVECEGRTVTLEPMQRFIFDGEGGMSGVSGFDPEITALWRRELNLDNIPLEDAFRMIATHFGVIVVNEGFSGGDRTVRALLRDNDLNEVLGILQQTHYDFDYRIAGDTVFITDK